MDSAPARIFDAPSNCKILRFQIDLKQRIHQLHCFVNTSSRAFACLRTRADDAIHINLLFSKARIAPIQTECTIPCVELFAALLGARVLKFITKEPDDWTNNPVVRFQMCHTLDQLTKDITKLCPRQSRQNLQHTTYSSSLCSFWIEPSGYHPSRGIRFKLLQSTWWHGPDYLWSSLENWPMSKEGHQPLNDCQFGIGHSTDAALAILSSNKGAYAPFAVPDHCRNSYSKLIA